MWLMPAIPDIQEVEEEGSQVGSQHNQSYKDHISKTSSNNT
jgi:hypothetical protein